MVDQSSIKPMKTDTKINCQLVCINCGHAVKELYRKYSPSVLKMINCNECHEIADKYLEYEPIVVLIDLILLDRSAFRHILFNSEFRMFWKMALFNLLMESYILWKDKQWNVEFTTARIVDEERFYFSFALAIIDKFLLFLLLRIITQFFVVLSSSSSTNKQSSLSVPSINFFKTIILSSIARFFVIPILIWKNNTSDLGIALHSFLVTSYYIISLTIAHSVLMNYKKTHSAMIICIVTVIKFIALEQISDSIKHYFWNRY